MFNYTGQFLSTSLEPVVLGVQDYVEILEKTAAKYPVEKARGSHKKYTEL